MPNPCVAASRGRIIHKKMETIDFLKGTFPFRLVFSRLFVLRFVLITFVHDSVLVSDYNYHNNIPPDESVVIKSTTSRTSPECPVSFTSDHDLTHQHLDPVCRCTSLLEIWCQNLVVIPDFQITDDSRVFSGLYMTRQYIRGLSQGAFVNLNVLKIVLNFNQIGDVISASAFAGLGRHLRELHLGRCWIRTLPDGLLSGLDELTHLHLWSNHIQRIPPAFFKNVQNLRELILWGNNISSVDENTFAGLWKLRRLDLDRNNITSLNKEVFRHLAKLHVLYLGENRLHSLYAETFMYMHSLRVLKIDRNRLVYFNPKTFEGLGELLVLALHDNNISFIPDDMLAPMLNLTSVQLSNNRIEFILPKTFSGLRVLSALYLGGNKLTSIPDGAFRQTHKLRQLFLERNQLQGMDDRLI